MQTEMDYTFYILLRTCSNFLSCVGDMSVRYSLIAICSYRPHANRVLSTETKLFGLYFVWNNQAHYKEEIIKTK